MSCLTIAPDTPDDFDLRALLSAPAASIRQSKRSTPPSPLPQTKRIMVKDEDVCLHCGLCAERCPTAAWDMSQFELVIPYAGRLREVGSGRREAGTARIDMVSGMLIPGKSQSEAVRNA